MSEPYLLTIVNNSNKKVLLKWLLEESQELVDAKMIKNEAKGTLINKNLKEIQNKQNKEKRYHFLGSNDSNVNRKSCVFNVFPEEVVVPARGSYDFKVYFTPSKQEYYFFSNLFCLGYLINNPPKPKNDEMMSQNDNQLQQVKQIKGLISNSALGMINRSHVDGFNKSTFSKNNSYVNTTQNNNETMSVEPPIPLKISVVGHSFPPSTQIYIPMAEVYPKHELNFPYSSINQSQFSSLIIKNTTDTPLYFKFISDVNNVFRVYPKCGVISPQGVPISMC